MRQRVLEESDMPAKFMKVLAFPFGALFVSGVAFANLEQVKTYKAVFPDEEKPKCVVCHVDKLPKKEDGKHDWNDYGKKILDAKKELKKEKVDEEVLEKVGKNEAAETE